MRRSFLSILVVAAAVVGYASGSHPVVAQGDPLPYAVGDTVVFTLPDGGTPPDCRVEEIRGIFVRCGAVSRGASSWTNVSAMTYVKVKATQ